MSDNKESMFDQVLNLGLVVGFIIAVGVAYGAWQAVQNQTREIASQALLNYNLPANTPHTRNIAKLMAAIFEAEEEFAGNNAHGIGPGRITEAYWRDATAQYPERRKIVPYEYCKDDAGTLLIVSMYINRHAPALFKRFKDTGNLDDAEMLARIHKGGPNWQQKPEAEAFGKRVRNFLVMLEIAKNQQKD